MEGISDAYYLNKDCKMNNLDEHHDLYIQSNSLFLTDKFEIFQYICPE